MIHVYTDGAAIQRKKASWGYLIKDDENWLTQDYGTVPVHRTNVTSNAAEHYAITMALEWLCNNDLKNDRITLYSDSKMAISQLFRGWQCRDTTHAYAQFYFRNMELLRLFKSIKGKLIPRNQNTYADELSKKCL